MVIFIMEVLRQMTPRKAWNNKRWVNDAKVLGIFLVVFAHAIILKIQNESISLQKIRQVIYIFHMPFFFFLSGYLFELNLNKYCSIGWKKFLEKKFIRLMLPYFSISFCVYMIYFLLDKIGLFKSITGGLYISSKEILDVLCEVITLNGHVDSHMWFLYALFIIFALQYILHDYWISTAGIITQVVFTILLTLLPLPELALRVLYNMLYFSIGRQLYLGKGKSIVTTKMMTAQLLAAVIFTVLSIYLWSGNTAFEELTLLVRFLRRAVNCCVAILTISLITENLIRFENYNENIILHCISENEFGIYLFHQPFIVAGTVSCLHGLFDGNLWNWIIVLLGTTIGMLVPVIMSLFVKRFRLLKLLLLGELK